MVRKVLLETGPYRDQLRAAALNMNDKEVGAGLRQMADTTDQIIGEVEKTPEKLTLVLSVAGTATYLYVGTRPGMLGVLGKTEKLFGFVGVLVALPVSAVGVVAWQRVRALYLGSPLYQG